MRVSPKARYRKASSQPRRGASQSLWSSTRGTDRWEEQSSSRRHRTLTNWGALLTLSNTKDSMMIGATDSGRLAPGVREKADWDFLYSAFVKPLQDKKQQVAHIKDETQKMQVKGVVDRALHPELTPHLQHLMKQNEHTKQHLQQLTKMYGANVAAQMMYSGMAYRQPYGMQMMGGYPGAY